MSSTGRYPGFRAPQGDGEILCVPRAAELPALVQRNRSRPEFRGVNWFGRPLVEIAKLARREILQAALDHTSRYADISFASTADEPLVVTGHQAELFHPGVWLKNFFATRMARESGGTAINLIIDTDLCRATAIRVPTIRAGELGVEIVPFDTALAETPFEEREIADRGQWRSFGERVSRLLQPLVSDPLISDWWPMVVAASQHVKNLGLAISQARHQCELNWGSKSLELPQSQICQTDAFRLFALQLFTRAMEFREAHNRALTEYRDAHKLKNRAQPMPNLGGKDAWIEAPFWLWSPADAQRRAVFVDPTGKNTVVSDLHKHSLTLPNDAASAVESLAAWEARGIKLRTRALSTTLFARLLLADLFIHGIGGAKYDQVTDHICELFFGYSLPRYATVSGTLRLPLASESPQVSTETDLRQVLRSLRFHPERFCERMIASDQDTGRIHHLVAQKRRWVDTPKSPANAAERHLQITEANEGLQAFLANYKAMLEHAIAQARLDANASRLCNSREYAYCLFPENLLLGFFQS